jgi:hypothetical protein
VGLKQRLIRFFSTPSELLECLRQAREDFCRELAV